MIIAEEDLEIFKKSKCIHEIMEFIHKMAAAVKSKPISATNPNPKFELLCISQYLI